MCVLVGVFVTTQCSLCMRSGILDEFQELYDGSTIVIRCHAFQTSSDMYYKVLQDVRVLASWL